MKSPAWLLATLLILTGCTKLAPPELIQGTWFLKCSDRDDPCYFTLQLNNGSPAQPPVAQSKLSGTYELYRPGPNPSCNGDVRGSVEGSKVSFVISAPVNAKPSVRWREAHFQGQLSPPEESPDQVSQLKKIGFPTPEFGAKDVFLEWPSPQTWKQNAARLSRPEQIRLMDGNLYFLTVGETPDALHPPVTFLVTLGQFAKNRVKD